MAYSEYAMENINLEESKILYEEKWYSLEELKGQIKSKVNSDDFDVIPLATTIQELSKALQNITTVKITLHKDLISKYKEVAHSSGSTFENLLRDALISRVDYGLTNNMKMEPGRSDVASSVAPKKMDTTEDYKPKKVACRKCRAVIVVDSPERPITITCPECGTKGKLSK
ncbi:hypothetical protein [[Eubacterium] cellulosolvens]